MEPTQAPAETQPAKTAPKTEVSTKVTKLERPASMLEVIARAVMDPACDTGKMRELINMQKEIEDAAARKAYTRAFINMQDHLPTIDANGRLDMNSARTGKQGAKSRYARYNDIHKAVKPLLREHGFSLSYATEPMPGAADRMLVRGFLEHVDGHSRTTSFPLPAEGSGSKNSAQAWGSAFTHGKRYCVVALLDIVSEAPEDRDDDGRASEGQQREPVINPAQAKKIMADIAAANLPMETFVAKYGRVEDLTASTFEEASRAVADFKARMA